MRSHLTPIVLLGALSVALTSCVTPAPEKEEAHKYGHGADQNGTEMVKPTPSPTPAPENTESNPPKLDNVDPTVNPPVVNPTPMPTPATQDYPVASPVDGKPGFVTSPYSASGIVDVRGYPPGTEVRDPYSGKIFLVP